MQQGRCDNNNGPKWLVVKSKKLKEFVERETKWCRKSIRLWATKFWSVSAVGHADNLAKGFTVPASERSASSPLLKFKS